MDFDANQSTYTTDKNYFSTLDIAELNNNTTTSSWSTDATEQVPPYGDHIFVSSAL